MNTDDILKCLGKIAVHPPPDVEMWCISSEDFDGVVETFTYYGTLIVPYMGDGDGWRYIIVEESPFTGIHTTNLAVMDSIPKGQTVRIDRQVISTFQPFVEFDPPVVDSGWSGLRYEIVPPTVSD